MTRASGFGSSDLDLPAEAAAPEGGPADSGSKPDLGDLVVMLLAGTLAGLGDRLRAEGFEEASDLVGELSDRCDEYSASVGPSAATSAEGEQRRRP